MNRSYDDSGGKSSGDIDDQSESFIKTPTIIQDALCRTRIPGEARQILDVIIRQTFGWHKTEDKISLGLFYKKTGVKRGNVVRAMKCLEDMKIIVPDRTGYITSHKINLRTEEWMAKPKHKTGIRNDNTFKTAIENDNTLQVFSETITEVFSETIPGVLRNDNKTAIRNDTHKRKKENITKETHKESAPPHAEEKTDVQEMAEKNVCVFSLFKETALFLCDAIRQNGAKLIRPDVDSWAKVLSGIGDPPEELEAIITWAQNHNFWKSRTMTAENFARNYSTIRIQMSEEGALPDESAKRAIEEYLQEKNGGNKETIPDKLFDQIFDAIRECKSISELMTIWNEHPEYDGYDVLRKEKDHRIWVIAHKAILCAKSVDELDGLFNEEETYFTGSVPNIGPLYCDKYKKLTGISLSCPTDI